MEVVIIGLTVPDPDEVQRQGPAYPTLGPFLNGGTYCTIDDVAATAGGPPAILRAARAAALEAAVPFAETADPASLPSGGNRLVLLVSSPAPADLQRIGERAALCLLVAGGQTPSKPIVVLYGRHLPALGPVPACTVRDLASTCISLAGGAPQGGRHLLHEQAEPWDPQIEQQLTRRLRQLYGE
jgi:hypothetical protein